MNDVTKSTRLAEDSGASQRRKVSVAPMMAWTDRHCRHFLRQFSPSALLYTEMIVADAIVHGNRARLLDFSAAEQPLALQLGGAEPQRLAAAARVGADWGYREINLNCGCPSERVQSATFGACLMAEPERVGRCVAAMQDAVSIPVTVKTRIGIDDRDSYEFLRDFVGTVAAAGCGTFIIHARKAILHGLSPKENREIPPLDYTRAWQLKQEFPSLDIHVNGGMKTLADCAPHWSRVDGVMIGREAYHRPLFLSELHAETSAGAGDEPVVLPTPEQIVLQMRPYVLEQLARGEPLHAMTRHMLGLFAGRPGARVWRRILSTAGCRADAGFGVVEQALRATELGRVAA